MIFHRTKRISFRVTATTAIGVAALMAAGSTSPPPGPGKWSLRLAQNNNLGQPAGRSSPPPQIDNEFMKQYPNVKVTLETEANVTAGYVTLLATSVDSSSADS